MTAPPGARADRWRARAKVRDADGVRRDVERYASSKAAARHALETALRERTTPVLSGDVTPSTTVAEAARLWLADIEAQGRAPNTLAAYAGTVARHVETGPLAALTLREVTVGAVDRALRSVAASSGPGAAKMTRTVLGGIFAHAVRHGAMATNPVRDAAPVRREGKPTARALTRAERDGLVAFADADPTAQANDVADLIAFMAGTGVRIGEACALRWADVDLTAGTVSIAGTVIRTAGGGTVIQDRPKTDAGARTIALPPWVLRRLERRQATATGDVVFPSPNGHLRDLRNTARHLRDVFDRAGFPWATGHTLRKTVATLLDDAGLSAREVANVLGHERPSLTQDVYLDRRHPSERAAAVL